MKEIIIMAELTVGKLRELIADLPDDMPVVLMSNACLKTSKAQEATLGKENNEEVVLVF